VIQKRAGVSALLDVFSLDSPSELRELATAAGFQRVEVTPVSMIGRFPNPAGFLAGEIDVDTAAIPSMQHLDAGARQEIVAAIAEDMRSSLAEVTRDDHVVIQFYAHLVRASR
jgi:hypothetical protein